jgi:hypothetical protein
MKSQGVDQTNKTQHAQAVNQIQQADKAKQVDGVGKLDKMQQVDKTSTAKALDPVTQKSEVNKSGSMVMSMMSNMEKGQASIDKLINGGINGAHMSNSEMLSLQAGMYKYTQELELTGKVVEKATSGLKDTLKTQV